MDSAARQDVHRRRSTMLKHIPGNQREEDGASPFEPEWGNGDDNRILMNHPGGAWALTPVSIYTVVFGD